MTEERLAAQHADEITGDMLSAGVAALLEPMSGESCFHAAFAEESVRKIFVAMRRAQNGLLQIPSGLEIDRETLVPLSEFEMHYRPLSSASAETSDHDGSQPEQTTRAAWVVRYEAELAAESAEYFARTAKHERPDCRAARFGGFGPGGPDGVACILKFDTRQGRQEFTALGSKRTK